MCSDTSRNRTNIWEFEGTMLEYWSKGMIGVGSSEQKSLVAECGLMTGLTYAQIKVSSKSSLSITYFLGLELKFDISDKIIIIVM